MIVTLRESHKINLSFLTSQSSSVLQDFCKLAVEYFAKGPSLKMYQSVAQKLLTNPEVIQSSVEALVNLLIELCKHQVNTVDLRDTVLSVGFSDEHCEVLQELYNSQQAELTRALTERTVDLPQFKDLEWRLEAQVASRALLDQVTPEVLMKLSLENSSGVENVVLQSDIVNLAHFTQVIEDALLESKSQNFRRIQRRFK